MVLLPRLRVIIAAWIVTEVVLFALVAGAIGVPNTILLGVATSLAGFVLLRQGGTSALGRLRAMSAGVRPDAQKDSGMLDDVAIAASGLGLILPGFLSDLLGAALLIKPVRRRLAVRLVRAVGGTPPARDGTIDLDPAEWRHADRTPEPPPRLGHPS